PYIIRPFVITEEDTQPLWVNLQTIPSPTSSVEQRLPDEMRLREEMRQTRMLEERRQAAQTAENEITLSPGDFEVPQGREFRISVNLRSQQDIYNMSLNLSFNPAVLNLKQVLAGGFVRRQGLDSSFLQNIDSGSGICTIAFSSPDISQGVKGTGGIATLVFEAKEKGESAVTVDSVMATDTTGGSLVFTTKNARVVVR
ncbi:MAG: cohesin domain-containing protein, partial [Candidatus Aminicenantes bacterium]